MMETKLKENSKKLNISIFNLVDVIWGYEIKNKKLKRMVEDKADEIGISVDQLISNYINRGLMSDGINEDVFWRLHSEEYLKQINDTLDVD